MATVQWCDIVIIPILIGGIIGGIVGMASIGLVNGIASGVGFGLSLGLLFKLVDIEPFSLGDETGCMIWLYGMFWLGLISGLVLGITSGISICVIGLSSFVCGTALFNVRFRIMLYCGLLPGVLLGGVLGGLLRFLTGSGLGIRLTDWLIFGFTVFCVPLLSSRGAVSARRYLGHFLSRFQLWHFNYAPWNYIRFLDYAAERILLLKVGDSYFFHGLLMEYFAELVERYEGSEFFDLDRYYEYEID